MTVLQQAVCAELMAVLDFAMKSESPDVQAFGLLMLGRISQILQDGDENISRNFDEHDASKARELAERLGLSAQPENVAGA